MNELNGLPVFKRWQDIGSQPVGQKIWIERGPGHMSQFELHEDGSWRFIGGFNCPYIPKELA